MGMRAVVVDRTTATGSGSVLSGVVGALSPDDLALPRAFTVQGWMGALVLFRSSWLVTVLGVGSRGSRPDSQGWSLLCLWAVTRTGISRL